MTMAAVEERVDRLEDSIDRFVVNVGIEFNKLYNSQMRTEMELREFKDEMREFKDEMREFKDEMRSFKDEMGGFKDEMRSFKDEMHEDRREMNRKWGDLSNKLGTMVEDLVYPSLARVVKEALAWDVLDLSIRRKRRLPGGRMQEFDAIALTSDLVCLNSTKATLRSADVDGFVTEIAKFRDFFPEYCDLPLVGVLATLAIDEGVLNYAEKQGFLVLAVGDEIMEVKNRPGFEPRRW
ncbi:MAG: hypothetical protein WCA32_03655 [Chromatiaceae bacterium]